MKLTNILSKLLGCLCVIVCLSLCGCMTRTSKYMQTAGAPAQFSPPPGKTLVCIQRPSCLAGWRLYSSIWDNDKFIADLGNKHSVAYVCDPGTHYFINLSVEETGCVEANLLPDQTYDLAVKGGYGVWIASFKIEPVIQNDSMRKRVAAWAAENRWVDLGEAAPTYEQKRQEDVRRLIQEFTVGKRKTKLQHLSPDDHR